MTDGIGITKTGLSAVVKRPNLYQAETIRQVRARAESIPQDTSPEERDGLRRLNQILDQMLTPLNLELSYQKIKNHL